jgi:hypothetical protein
MEPKNQPVFAGMTAPSTDFEPVRDQRRATLLYLDVDLTSARSQAAGTALYLPIAGNSFYIDQDPVNVGNGIIHFQDTVFAGVAPVYVNAGFIANVPFTQIVVENAAQPGKRLRIFYGVDIDFQAGINAQVAISGSLSLGINSITPHSEYDGSYQSINALAANTAEAVFLAAANTNGVILFDAESVSNYASNVANVGVFIAKNGTPANITDGVIILPEHLASGVGGNWNSWCSLARPVKIPAGLGLYFISTTAQVASTALRCAHWDVL